MAFQFNFNVKEEVNENIIKSNDAIRDVQTVVSCKNMKPKVQIKSCVLSSLNEILSRWRSSDDPYSIEWIQLNNDEKICYVRSHTTESNFNVRVCGEHNEEKNITSKDSPTPCANLLETADLVPQVYEGGLKIWDCSMDLANFVVESELNFKDKIILEVGCGVGLPGMVAAKASAKTVVFQDFNEFVLDTLTGPSVYLNESIQNQKNNEVSEKIQSLGCGGNEFDLIAAEVFDMGCPTSSEKYSFIAGDWSDVESCLNTKVDIVLSSETIYDPANYEKLHSLICNSLLRKGIAYIAAKSFYFGVGGGVQSWIEFVASKRIFLVQRIQVIDAPLKREILKMTFQQN